MKKIVKRVRFWTALVGVCVLVILSSAWAVKVATANVTHSDSFTVVIDAGHGGIDGQYASGRKPCTYAVSDGKNDRRSRPWTEHFGQHLSP